MKSLDPWVRIQELELRVEELTTANVEMRIERGEDRKALDNIRINLKNLAFIADTPFVELAKTEPTKKRSYQEE